jgi:hypothetical protein
MSVNKKLRLGRGFDGLVRDVVVPCGEMLDSIAMNFKVTKKNIRKLENSIFR